MFWFSRIFGGLGGGVMGWGGGALRDGMRVYFLSLSLLGSSIQI